MFVRYGMNELIADLEKLRGINRGVGTLRDESEKSECLRGKLPERHLRFFRLGTPMYVGGLAVYFYSADWKPHNAIL